MHENQTNRTRIGQTAYPPTSSVHPPDIFIWWRLIRSLELVYQFIQHCCPGFSITLAFEKVMFCSFHCTKGTVRTIDNIF